MTSPDFIYGMDFKTFFHLIDSLYDEILIYDDNYNIVYINQACVRHYGVPPEKMIGKSFWDFVDSDWWSPSILPVVYEEKRAYAINQSTLSGETLLTIALPIFGDDGKIKYVIMSVRDDTRDVALYNPQYISHSHGVSRALTPEIIPVGESPELERLLSLADKVGAIDVTCVLMGETGTGKTMLAKYIHMVSPRNGRPFVSLNCAAIPADLVESELFGYSKGAFTGANPGGKRGLLEMADKGTVLLDEISELSLSAQAKILQFLQEKTFIPVGGDKPVSVDVRIIAATNRNLKNMMAMGQFRKDLYYRLSVVELHLPPLRKRKGDIPLLVNHFLSVFGQKYGLVKQITQDAMAVLVNHDWQGNIRELAHLVERLVVTSDALVVDVQHLPTSLFGLVDPDETTPASPETPEGATLDDMMEQYEAAIVRAAYQKCGSSRRLAEHLAISQTKANNLIRKYVTKP
ncbi:MAG: sigma 54-interacting transcriptional regulator [Planctomycetes bacterium]|nr:sigma 54-interacting transcriptional regulator [Planctomycetota bacterium]